MNIQKQKPLTKRRNQTFKGKVKKRLMLLIVPHHHNQYHPHLIRSWLLVPVLLMVFGMQVGINLATSGEVLGEKSTISTQDLLTTANTIRKKNGVGELKINHELSVAAQAKAQDMVLNQYWSHVSPQGIQPWSWVEESGYTYKTAGENLAKNFHSAGAITQAWYDSPPHRENLLDSDFSDVGFATVEGVLDNKPVVFTVALYGQPMFAGATAVAAPAAVLPAGEIAVFNSSGTYGQLGVLDRMQLALQEVPPVAFVTLAVLTILLLLALVSQFHYHKQPVSRHRSFFLKHHGLAKGMGLGVMNVSILLTYGSGQI
jgi:hypothetical protein